MCGRYRIKDTDELTAELRRVFKIPDWVMGPRYGHACLNRIPNRFLRSFVPLVPCPTHSFGYSRASFMRASFVVKRQLTGAPRLFRTVSHAATS